MPSWVVALLFGSGVAGWTYTKLVHANGNPSRYGDLIAAGVAGVIAFVVLFTLMKFIFNF